MRRPAALVRLVAALGAAAASPAAQADTPPTLSSDPVAEAHLRLAERDLREFLDEPQSRRPRPPRIPPPPGRPIG